MPRALADRCQTDPIVNQLCRMGMTELVNSALDSRPFTVACPPGVNRLIANWTAPAIFVGAKQVAMLVTLRMAADIVDIIDQIDEVIGEIKAPTLLLTSDLPEDSEEFQLAAKSAAMIPGASLIAFEGFSHKELFNRSAEVLPHIQEFLAEVR